MKDKTGGHAAELPAKERGDARHAGEAHTGKAGKKTAGKHTESRSSSRSSSGRSSSQQRTLAQIAYPGPEGRRQEGRWQPGAQAGQEASALEMFMDRFNQLHSHRADHPC
jgi:hypothetical protein